MVLHLVARVRSVYVDLGSKRGESVQHFLRSTPDAHRYSVHAFEPNPAHIPALRSFAQRSPAAARITVHPQAAWTAATQVRAATGPRTFV